MIKTLNNILSWFGTNRHEPKSYAPHTITFTGLDSQTDLNRLAEIQARYPYAEFGVLVSVSKTGCHPRYPDFSFIEKLKEYKSLNLSCHVCGGTLLEPIVTYGDFGYLDQFLCGNLSIFKRIQLNLGGNVNWLTKRCKHKLLRIGSFENIQEIILQQKKKIGSIAWNVGRRKTKISVLIDPSGGKGRETKIVPKLRFLRTGYAGGINPSNAARKFLQLKNSGICRNFWIDMESGVRTDDWFDLDNVEAVLKEIDPLQKTSK